MDELLKALQEANSISENSIEEAKKCIVIDGLACDLFITELGQPNMAQINEFEKYAPCKIGPAEQDSFGWLIGYIRYNGRTYYFG